MTVQSREGSGCQYTGITENWFSSQTNRRGRGNERLEVVLEGLDRRSLGQLPSVDGVGSRRERIFFSLENERDKRKNGRGRGGGERRKGSVKCFSPKYRRVSEKFIRSRASFKNFSAVLQGVVADRMYLSDLVYSSSHRFPNNPRGILLNIFFFSSWLRASKNLNKINNLETIL